MTSGLGGEAGAGIENYGNLILWDVYLYKNPNLPPTDYIIYNGPDNASMVAPDDVRAVAEDEGIPIYVISTNDASKDPVSSNVFKRISARTGGQVYFAKTWQKQVEAFEYMRKFLGTSMGMIIFIPHIW